MKRFRLIYFTLHIQYPKRMVGQLLLLVYSSNLLSHGKLIVFLTAQSGASTAFEGAVFLLCIALYLVSSMCK